MPKLDGTHLPERLTERLADLKAGKEVAARDVKALLNDEQVEAMDAAWAEQQALRKKKKARTKEEEKELGWKSKRDVYIAVYERALNDAHDNEKSAWEKKQQNPELRQARIYFEALDEAEAAGKSAEVAKNWANNELTRAGLRRLDGKTVGHQSKRDREVFEMEAQLRAEMRKQLTAEELEQVVAYEEHEKAMEANRKKRGW